MTRPGRSIHDPFLQSRSILDFPMDSGADRCRPARHGEPGPRRDPGPSGVFGRGLELESGRSRGVHRGRIPEGTQCDLRRSVYSHGSVGLGTSPETRDPSTDRHDPGGCRPGPMRCGGGLDRCGFPWAGFGSDVVACRPALWRFIARDDTRIHRRRSPLRPPPPIDHTHRP